MRCYIEGRFSSFIKSLFIIYNQRPHPLCGVLMLIVGEEGLEPTVQIGTDLQSVRLPITDYSPNYERKIVFFVYIKKIYVFIDNYSK